MAVDGQGRRGPLAGLRVLDLSGLGPAPFATMMLADFGAEVLSVRRPDPLPFDPAAAMARGKDAIGVDLRSPEGQAVARRLARSADIFVEGFRPGVMERLGLGPEVLMADNPGLIYARLTGWGQSGPYAKRAGHDINYLAISGALAVIGEDKPTAPPGLLGDLANGSYTMMIGVLMALVERQRTGRGQVVDAAIVDGASYMLGPMFGELELGLWDGDPDHAMLGGKAPFYGVYRCADGKWFSVGAIEQKFYAAMLSILGLDDVDPSAEAQMDRDRWPALRERIAAAFLTKPQAAWTEAFGAVDSCGAPVLAAGELAADPHNAARGTVTADGEGILTAAPAPRLSEHPELVTAPNPRGSRPADTILAEAGFTADEIGELTAKKAVWSL
ncbi:L-carnitine dehydratase/bile acid-inducible protein F [Rhizorhabdus wittichii RW1]|uniref:L-carnitine dehydratase/bile acid-inducible protein F n=1 Tax=Rhizorhabdus wittichii (strain DSM 6014 / CCUG 31198 / JCM 15750 / NBRC 105917 / EY 4224 / RW1) TaxID=392499 RepID=A0A9J9H9X2_RHIWR|nr:L-carnitine dehydratase/bile acid-inducible protein F [Rhizorhabdus wittichii RW1]